MMALDDLATAAAHHRQGQFQLLGRCWSGVGNITVNTDLGGRIEAQPHTFLGCLQAMFQVSVQAFRIEMTKQGLGGEIRTGTFFVGKCLTATQGASGGGDAIDETHALGRLQHPLIHPGQYWRVKHDHTSIVLRAAQRSMQMQHTAQRVPYTPDRL
ncbi:hypothetical protein D3C77_615240 [compost metagenome]